MSIIQYLDFNYFTRIAFRNQTFDDFRNTSRNLAETPATPTRSSVSFVFKTIFRQSVTSRTGRVRRGSGLTGRIMRWWGM